MTDVSCHNYVNILGTRVYSSYVSTALTNMMMMKPTELKKSTKDKPFVYKTM